MEPANPVLDDLVAALRTATCKSQALTSAALTRFLRDRGHQIDERRVRDVIATHYRELSQRLGSILLAEAPAGYWLTGSAEEIVHREQLLHALAKAGREKHHEYIALVKSFGFGGILPVRKEEGAAA